MNYSTRITDLHRKAVKLLLVGALIGFLFPRLLISQQAQEKYGDADGRFAQSLNGLAVFAEMLRTNGAEVKMQRTLTERADDADLLVWAPDRLNAPNVEEYELLLDRNSTNRLQRVLFVGRDYDATISYWESVIDRIPKEKLEAAQNHLETRRMLWGVVRGPTDREISNELFDYKVVDRWEPATEISGDLARGVNRDAANLTLTGEARDFHGFDMEVLLYANGEPFVFVLTDIDYDSTLEIYVVTNGSLLLNLPLVNHENRRITQNLIDLIDAKNVVILSSGADDISQTNDQSEPPNFWDWLAVPPFNWIISHLILLGIVFLFCYYPIFGRPRKLPPANVSEFKTHIEAVGKLMEKTGDKKFARDAIEHYNHVTGHQSKS